MSKIAMGVVITEKLWGCDRKPKLKMPSFWRARRAGGRKKRRWSETETDPLALPDAVLSLDP